VGKGGRCVGLTTLPSLCADCFEIWEPPSPGTLCACPGMYRDCLIFYLLFDIVNIAEYFLNLSVNCFPPQKWHTRNYISNLRQEVLQELCLCYESRGKLSGDCR